MSIPPCRFATLGYMRQARLTYGCCYHLLSRGMTSPSAQVSRARMIFGSIVSEMKWTAPSQKAVLKPPSNWAPRPRAGLAGAKGSPSGFVQITACWSSTSMIRTVFDIPSLMSLSDTALPGGKPA